MKCGRKGWRELEAAGLSRDDEIEIWQHLAVGERSEAIELLAHALDRDDEEICGVDMIAEPDDMLTDRSFYRIWIKECE
jgi:hypothetical protein